MMRRRCPEKHCYDKKCSTCGVHVPPKKYFDEKRGFDVDTKVKEVESLLIEREAAGLPPVDHVDKIQRKYEQDLVRWNARADARAARHLEAAMMGQVANRSAQEVLSRVIKQTTVNPSVAAAPDHTPQPSERDSYQLKVDEIIVEAKRSKVNSLLKSAYANNCPLTLTYLLASGYNFGEDQLLMSILANNNLTMLQVVLPYYSPSNVVNVVVCKKNLDYSITFPLLFNHLDRGCAESPLNVVSVVFALRQGKAPIEDCALLMQRNLTDEIFDEKLYALDICVKIGVICYWLPPIEEETALLPPDMIERLHNSECYRAYHKIK